MAELWDVYSRDRVRTGKFMERGAQFEPGAYHLIVHICIFHSNGKMLIQQRQPFKKGWPNLWDVTVGGSAVAGESSTQAAEREVAEEIGLTISLGGSRPALSLAFEHGFDDFYLLRQDVSLSGLVLQLEEVKQVRWATEAEILSMIQEKIFLPYQNSFIRFLFDMNRDGGIFHP